MSERERGREREKMKCTGRVKCRENCVAAGGGRQVEQRGVGRGDEGCGGGLSLLDLSTNTPAGFQSV